MSYYLSKSERVAAIQFKGTPESAVEVLQFCKAHGVQTHVYIKAGGKAPQYPETLVLINQCTTMLPYQWVIISSDQVFVYNNDRFQNEYTKGGA